MKIISKPKSKSWRKRSTCDNCETVVSLEPYDFVRRIFDDRDGDAVVYVCPTCKRENWVALSTIPTHVHHLLP